MNKNILFFGSLLLVFFIVVAQSKHYKELGWNEISSLETFDKQPITFRIYLKHKNLDQLSEIVRNISSPKSPNYAKYLKPSEINEIIALDTDSTNLIKHWVNSFNPIEIVDYSDSLKITMTKKNIETMFKVKINQYIHSNGNRIFRSPIDLTINHKYSKYIDLITGISNFPVVSKRSSRINKDFTNKKTLLSEFSKLSSSSSDSSDSSGSESSSGEPPVGLTIIQILGFGDYATVTFAPACSPKCGNNLQKVQINSLVTALNTVLNQSTSTTTTALCTSSGNITVCSANINSIIYLPTEVSLYEPDSGTSTTYPYVFISTPIITPQAIKDYYGLPEGYVITTNVTQSVVEFEQQYMNVNDLETFFQTMGLPWDYNLTFIGYNDQTNPGVEASLDIEYLLGIAPGASTTFWSIYANSTVEIDDILSWAVAIFYSDNPPSVSSLSYGMTEVNVDKYQGKGYLARSDVEFQKLALIGLTVIIASGDSGASDLGGPPMGTSTCDTLHADWPSQSQYVTSVGSTYFTPLDQPICYQSVTEGGTSCIHQPMGEISVSVSYGMMWTSGSGMSSFSPRAWYQADFVEDYVTTYASLLPPSNLFNVGGRAYPDFATVGHNLYIINNNSWMSVDGTSASAPIFAGLITILNDVRAKAGLPNLGFLNPLFYQIKRDYPEAFYDVVVGDNKCGIAGESPSCCPYGYQASPNFDPLTGLGRPNMDVLMKIITLYY